MTASPRVVSGQNRFDASCEIPHWRAWGRSSRPQSAMTRCATTAGCCGACGHMPGATFAARSEYNEGPMRRFGFAVLLAVQALASGAVSLAHARDVLVAPAGVETRHSSRCAILHDELRCALCHYAGTRVVAQHTI